MERHLHGERIAKSDDQPRGWVKMPVYASKLKRQVANAAKQGAVMEAGGVSHRVLAHPTKTKTTTTLF
jgi:hypothetical protein